MDKQFHSTKNEINNLLKEYKRLESKFNKQCSKKRKDSTTHLFEDTLNFLKTTGSLSCILEDASAEYYGKEQEMQESRPGLFCTGGESISLLKKKTVAELNKALIKHAKYDPDVGDIRLVRELFREVHAIGENSTQRLNRSLLILGFGVGCFLRLFYTLKPT